MDPHLNDTVYVVYIQIQVEVIHDRWSKGFTNLVK